MQYIFPSVLEFFLNRGYQRLLAVGRVKDKTLITHNNSAL